MSGRSFDLYSAERHATDRAISTALWAVRAYYLSRYTMRDWTRRALGRKGGRP